MPDEANLSPEELDALLGSLGEKVEGAGGEGSAVSAAPSAAAGRGKVKVYDFRRPDRFSKDQMRTLEMVHDSFARLFQASLSTYLRSLIDAKVAAVRQMTYQEYIAELPNPTSINIFTMEPLKSNAILELNLDLMFAMIDRVLGGPGIVPKKLRELTTIETPVVERIVVRALDNLREAWQKVMPVVPKLEVVESNPAFVQIAAPSEMVATISIDVKIREQAGHMSLCLPYVLLEPIVNRLSAREWITSGQKGPTSDSLVNVKRGLGDTLVNMTAILGRARISVQELMNLRKGDLVRIERGIREELTLEIEGREKYRAWPGTSNRKNAVVISRVITPPEDF